MNHYPDISNNDFYEKIYKKKEFQKTTIPIETRSMDTICKKTQDEYNFKLLPQQEFLKNYISEDTPYNGILVIHGTGVGKTCSAISICEGFRNDENKIYKKNLIILSPSIKENFKKEIYNFEKEKLKIDPSSVVQCTGKTYELKNKETKHYTKEQRINEINKKIKENYEFNGYQKFTNDLIKATQWDIDKETPEIVKEFINKTYSNRVIIIDEIQNIKDNVSSSKNEEKTDFKKIQKVLIEVVKNTVNMKLVLMSATPMFDKPQEIIFLLNLLLLNDNKEVLNQNKLFNKKDFLKKGASDILYNASKGYISYLKGENPNTFPTRFYPKNSIIPNLDYNIKGNKIPTNEKLRFTNLVNIPMSKIQYDVYYANYCLLIKIIIIIIVIIIVIIVIIIVIIIIIII